MSELKEGDYVFASKYADGDPHDHFCVGFFQGMTWHGRFEIVDSEGKLFRHNGFRRCQKISKEVGDTLVADMRIMEQACSSVWYWRYHPAQLQKLLSM